MDALQLSVRVSMGNRKAAKRLGSIARHYRAVNPFSPLKTEPLQVLAASFTTDYGYMRAARFGQAARIGIFDAAGFEAGDILVSTEGTFYVAAMPLLQPILCVKAERLVSIRRTIQSGSDTGLQDYGGTTAANGALIMSGWPANILLSRGGEHSPLKLPGETRSAWHNIMMPAFRGVFVHAGDFITDDAGHRFVISGSELTDMGWRLTALQVTV
ncbi:hypothetical protein SAMN05518863_106134 [Candidatus Pantoea symbiotica]|jgi:hypothetical protein|uniref:Uncharacterized protein n=1 Tax=Candidatus Pantoea symbiotica TaxID=1884370 RepID=A0A1I3YLV2_9GAMM|nr:MULTISPECIES: hypothetical protein [Pantoea]SFK32848.1 hypothetical protein SAMN05518863_106134 [Pantoea symbiotica]SFU86356.1 hypothetical protein SAMN05518864_106134 [Pantoea sp. YR525]